MFPLGVLKHKNPNTLLALGFNTDYSDASIYGHIFTPVNSPNLVGGDLSVSGNSYIYTPDDVDLELSSMNFTIEARVRLSGVATQNRNMLVKQTTSAGIPLLFNISNSSQRLSFTMINQSETALTLTGTVGSFTDTLSYHHVAAVRSGDTFYLWQDGVLISTNTAVGYGTMKNTVSDWFIGAANSTGAGNFNGVIDWLKVSKTALYTAPFTPPTILTV